MELRYTQKQKISKKGFLGVFEMMYGCFMTTVLVCFLKPWNIKALYNSSEQLLMKDRSSCFGLWSWLGFHVILPWDSMKTSSFTGAEVQGENRRVAVRNMCGFVYCIKDKVLLSFYELGTEKSGRAGDP